MLPFTKRPGRAEDADVVTKDDLEQPTSGTKRSQPPAAMRPRQESFSDEELTNLIPSKSLGLEKLDRPLPAAGRPAAPASGSVPAPRSSARAMQKFKDEDEEEEDGRTVVRGAPKIVKRSKGPPPSVRGELGGMNTQPTTISPAAVIKQTLESAREARDKAGIMGAGPSRALEMHPADEGPQNTMMMDPMRMTGPQQLPPASFNPQLTGPLPQMSNQMATAAMAMAPVSHPSSRPGPLTNPGVPSSHGMMMNPNMTGPHQAISQSYSQAPPGFGPYSGPPSSMSVPGVAPSSMPAHFMTAQAPYSDPRMDPPGTSITQRGQFSAGRPTMSWAAALLAFGLFVGVGAVAVMQGNADGVASTTGQFVDPASAGRAAANGAKPNAAPTQAGEKVAVPTVGVPVGTDPNSGGVAVVAQPTTVAQPAAVPPAGGAVVVTSTTNPPAGQTTTTAATTTTQQPVAVNTPKRTQPTYHKPVDADPPEPKPAPAAKPAKQPKNAPANGGGDDEELAKSKKMLEKMQEEQLGGAKF